MRIRALLLVLLLALTAAVALRTLETIAPPEELRLTQTR